MNFCPINNITFHRALTGALALGLVGCSSPDESETVVLTPQDGEFSALSYNVAGLPEGLSGSHPETNIPLISPLLNDYDLVLAQEDFAYHDQLAAQASHPHQSEPKVTYLKFVNDGLNRFSQFPWITFERVQWVTCFGDASTGASDCLAEKGFSMARTVLGEGVTVDIYNHHADAGGGAEDIAARTEGFDQLAKHIVQHSSGRVVLVAGDTNLHGDDPDDAPVLQSFKDETGLQDVCEVISCGSDRIDRFFFRDNELISIEPLSWAIGEQFVDAEGDDLSDHLAVNVTFGWATK
jgi:hypothetical protein